MSDKSVLLIPRATMQRYEVLFPCVCSSCLSHVFLVDFWSAELKPGFGRAKRATVLQIYVEMTVGHSVLLEQEYS